MSILAAVLLALALDRLLGEPKRFHPLVGFGGIAANIEKRFNRRQNSRLAGVLAWLWAVLPWVAVATVIQQLAGTGPVVGVLLGGFMLYLAIGWQSLLQHALAIAEPLESSDINSARNAVGMIVSRDTSELDETSVASAATESVLENGADAIFSAIFWFCLLGIPGVVLYRLSNTLDAMWGYKNDRFLCFGWAAARIDDVLNYIPARLTALSYALVGKTRIALRCWQVQATSWKSPNAGPVMAAGAGAINVSLGGAAIYHGQLQQRPPLGPPPGQGDQPSAKGIRAACGLVNRALLLWAFVITLILIGEALL
ncbi:adenosylcobinamide-phosphate synthase CbiB [Pontibacterium granulatum]|uniref:adenosylcobinamide-phosphate synthase CbiB n=1 Tax=Pontibacterium granulatum TaxID=2036029 RepID=UPI00249A2D6C|nr:adenosylcobinamide-phosphate synthase CbiB [Pontibacterium granulatum]MDI3323985.1 adenosylcobinamide-phosphate synthase CbiB [Pontibacterium granulatum]